ncbi:MAG: sigma-70 family RNA polymerase sigma factor [Pseudomonadota bacterium]
MARVAAGDQQAFAALVTAHGPRVRALALRQLRSAAEADDVAQDAFAAVWTRADRFDPARGTFRAWLYRIVANRCLDRQRWRVRWRMSGDEALESRASAEAGPARQTAGRDALARAGAAIRGLPKRQRLALLLSVVSGLSTAEIAEALGSSPQAAEQVLVRARRSLRRQAETEGWADSTAVPPTPDAGPP